MEPVHVIGHRNPDTDAIVAAIGYASYLRESRGWDARAACCGELQARTHWVLRQAGLPPPELILDVRPTVGMLCRREVITAQPQQTCLSVYRRMMEQHIRAIPVVDEQGVLLGMPTLQDMGQLFLPSDGTCGAANRRVRTSLENMGAALGAPWQHQAADSGVVEEMVLVVAASSVETTRRRASDFPPKQVVLLCGDRPEVHAMAVELGVRALVVTGGFVLEQSLLEQARAKGIAVLGASQDTASAAQLIRFSRPIGEALGQAPLRLYFQSPLREVMAEVQQSAQPLFAVIDEEDGRLRGVFSKSDLLEVPRKRLVLVDHNEFSQAVTGADEAEILEVIDHHRLSGNLRTQQPVRFINEPVGSSSTIVAIMHRMRGLKPSAPIAKCLAAGLIADTLHLTSPTTTATDRETLAWLCELAGIEAASFAAEFFAAGSLLREATPERAIEADRKVFEENGWRISISQIEEVGLEEFWKLRDALHESLLSLCRAHRLHFACLMVTDISMHHSVLLVAGDGRVAAALDYPQHSAGVYEMPGVVSRKKQLFPYLSTLVGRLSAP
jgi:manganese-dependent inorganic pyrophosphatase